MYTAVQLEPGSAPEPEPGPVLAPLAEALCECVKHHELETVDRGFDDDGDFFIDLEFTGRSGNSLYTRMIARDASNQVVAVTQLPVSITSRHRNEVLLELHKINTGLAVGAFTVDRAFKHISFRSGFNFPTREALSIHLLALTLTSNVDVADRFLPCILRILSRRGLTLWDE